MPKKKPLLTASQIDRMTDLDEMNRLLIKEAKRINTRISQIEKLPEESYSVVDRHDVQQFVQHFNTPKAGTRRTRGEVIGVKFSEAKALSAAEARVRLKAITAALSYKESTKLGATKIITKTQTKYAEYFDRSTSFAETKEIRRMFKELHDRGLLTQFDSAQVMKIHNLNKQSGGALAHSREELVTRYFEDTQLPVADAIKDLEKKGYIIEDGNIIGKRVINDDE